MCPKNIKVCIKNNQEIGMVLKNVLKNCLFI